MPKKPSERITICPPEIIKELELREAVIKAAKKWADWSDMNIMDKHIARVVCNKDTKILFKAVEKLLAFEKKRGRKL